jgi:hypothetical protein
MMIKKIIIIFIIGILSAIITTKNTIAQDNYFDCQWVDGACSFRSHDCLVEDGYGPGDDCETVTDQDLCESLVVSCTKTEEPPPPSCAVEGQYCDADKPCCTSDLYCHPGYSVCAPQPSVQCNNDTGIDTAIGCIPRDSILNIAGFLVRWAIGIGGGIAFLLMLYAGYMMMTSSGQPRRLQAAKELFISAMAGLIMLVFSVFILRIIGFDILGVL